MGLILSGLRQGGAFTAFLAFAAIGLMSAPAEAQQGASWKMVMIWNNQAAGITDYPSRARCEAGVAGIRAEIARRNQEVGKVERLPGGGIVTTLPVGAAAFCIPG